ncbi:MAG: RidA family protein [candidate division NC10 bacterium]|nr:RidA family protein [candidate division NC10 bacterium]
MAVERSIITPPDMAKPRGYSYGVEVRGGSTLYIAGQVAFDPAGKVVGAGDIVKQFEQALENFHRVLEAGGATPQDVVKLNIYTSDRAAYQANLKAIGRAYRAVFGHHYPAMTLVEVKSLYDEGILVEVEGVAVTDVSQEP